MTNAQIPLSPSERYIRGEITLDQATRAELVAMDVERRETPFRVLNVLIRLVILIVALPLMIVSLLSPRRWMA
jgi:hypothetical protein